MKKALSILIISIVFVSALFASGSGEVYPSRDITDICVFGAGGGTDVANRVIAAEMGNILGVNINVNNVTGGAGGSIGLYQAYDQASDGYTIIGVSESCVASAVMGGFDKRMNVFDFFIIGGSPDIISVTPDAPFQTVEELVEYAKANPNAIKAGASTVGSLHHLNLLGFMNGAGIQVNFIPYDGSASAQNAAMTGEVSLVITSVQEQAELIKGGLLRPLAVLIPEAYEFEGQTIPSAFDSYPDMTKYLPLEQCIGFAIKSDVPDDRKAIIIDAFEKAMASDTLKEYGENNYFTLSGAYGDEARAIVDNLESVFSWTLYDLGAARFSPEDFGIPRV